VCNTLGQAETSNSRCGNSHNTSVLLRPNQLAKTLILPFKNLGENRVQATNGSTNDSKSELLQSNSNSHFKKWGL
jgi:hypothetical protein